MTSIDNIEKKIPPEEKIKEELLKLTQSKRHRIFTKLIGAALGSVPWVGGFLSALADFKADESQVKNNQLYEQWLAEHSSKMNSLKKTLTQIMQRLDEFPEEINERLESDDYSQLIKKSFRSWDNADTNEKRELIRKLLTNAGTYKLVPDDLIRLFISWIDTYHEAHFAVIKIIHENPSGITRYSIWEKLHGTFPREDSLEADLFKLLIRDLSTGGVIRQYRETDYYGNFKKKVPQKSGNNSTIMKSAFDRYENYVLTELGSQFVHYTMNEAIPRIG